MADGQPQALGAAPGTAEPANCLLEAYASISEDTAAGAPYAPSRALCYRMAQLCSSGAGDQLLASLRGSRQELAYKIADTWADSGRSILSLPEGPPILACNIIDTASMSAAMACVASIRRTLKGHGFDNAAQAFAFADADMDTLLSAADLDVWLHSLGVSDVERSELLRQLEEGRDKDGCIDVRQWLRVLNHDSWGHLGNHAAAMRAVSAAAAPGARHDLELRIASRAARRAKWRELDEVRRHALEASDAKTSSPSYAAEVSARKSGPVDFPSASFPRGAHRPGRLSTHASLQDGETDAIGDSNEPTPASAADTPGFNGEAELLAVLDQEAADDNARRSVQQAFLAAQVRASLQLRSPPLPVHWRTRGLTQQRLCGAEG